ncbi:MAG: flagellar hook-basal body protein [Deltaproteobacteria bacterium]|nr:flagellar hook-basal body protein [Deltaproteobacteria bacterium]
MGSGKYGAVSGMIGRMRMMENISNQLSSVNVQAYKKGTTTFQARLAEANSGMATKGVNQVRVSGESIDFSPGPIEFTGNPLNLALTGDGFFQVQRKDGSFGYTRKGFFEINREGVLTDVNGRPVMSAGGGQITLTSSDVDIAPDGNIWYEGEQLGQVGVFHFKDNSVLRRAQDSMFIPPTGVQPELLPDPQLSQKKLEGSNVDVMRSMARMTSNLRAFEAMQKALKVYDEMDRKIADLGLIQ